MPKFFNISDEIVEVLEAQAVDNFMSLGGDQL
jgi:hypothetical protein